MIDICQQVPIASVLVDRENRQRRKLDTKDLEASIALRGLIQPIIVDRSFKLIAGERRLTACRNLGHREILCRFLEDLPEIERQIVELEENVQRSDLDWQDQTLATERIHQLYCQLMPDWNQERTAQALGISPALLSLYLNVARALQAGNKQVMEASGVSGAGNILARAQQRTMGDQLAELLAVTGELPDLPASSPAEPGADLRSLSESDWEQLDAPDRSGEFELKLKPVLFQPSEVQQQSFLEWAPSYSGPLFNLIHCDFPYGVNLFDGAWGRGAEPQQGYEDTSDTFFILLESFCKNLPKFASLSCHIMFWYSEKNGPMMRKMFAELAPQVKWQDYPLIWLKTDNAGIVSDPRRNPRHIYETCLMGSIGDRNVVVNRADAYASPSDRKLHPSCKPEPMLKHFFEMLVDSSTLMLDPTCGAGSSLRAADSLGAKSVLGLEIDQGHFETARDALSHSRLLRKASLKLGDIL